MDEDQVAAATAAPPARPSACSWRSWSPGSPRSGWPAQVCKWALGGGSAGQAFGASASALTTLGVSSAAGGASAAAYIEAVLGVGLVALIIDYLPSLYAAFSRREALVSKLAMRTGLPPAGPAILSRLWCPAGPQTVLNETW